MLKLIKKKIGKFFFAILTFAKKNLQHAEFTKCSVYTMRLTP